MSRLTRPHLLTGLALLGALAAAGSATAQDPAPQPDAARTLTNNLFERKNGVIQIEKSPFAFPLVSGTNVSGAGDGGTPVKVAASMTVSVTAATKRKYKLTSSIIMRGSTASTDITPSGSSGVVWRVKSTRSVARKLKGVKTLKGVTYKLTYTRPITETVSRKVDLYQENTTSNSNVKLVRLNSSGDTFQQPATDGGGRG